MISSLLITPDRGARAGTDKTGKRSDPRPVLNGMARIIPFCAGGTGIIRVCTGTSEPVIITPSIHAMGRRSSDSSRNGWSAQLPAVWIVLCVGNVAAVPGSLRHRRPPSVSQPCHEFLGEEMNGAAGVGRPTLSRVSQSSFLKIELPAQVLSLAPSCFNLLPAPSADSHSAPTARTFLPEQLMHSLI